MGAQSWRPSHRILINGKKNINTLYTELKPILLKHDYPVYPDASLWGAFDRLCGLVETGCPSCSYSAWPRRLAEKSVTGHRHSFLSLCLFCYNLNHLLCFCNRSPG